MYLEKTKILDIPIFIVDLLISKVYNIEYINIFYEGDFYG